MPDFGRKVFELRYVRKDGLTSLVEFVECETRLEALQRALAAAVRHRAEVWQDGEFITRLEPPTA